MVSLVVALMSMWALDLPPPEMLLQDQCAMASVSQKIDAEHDFTLVSTKCVELKQQTVAAGRSDDSGKLKVAVRSTMAVPVKAVSNMATKIHLKMLSSKILSGRRPHDTSGVRLVWHLCRRR